jgi:hypothetical protein
MCAGLRGGNNELGRRNGGVVVPATPIGVSSPFCFASDLFLAPAVPDILARPRELPSSAFLVRFKLDDPIQNQNQTGDQIRSRQAKRLLGTVPCALSLTLTLSVSRVSTVKHGRTSGGASPHEHNCIVGSQEDPIDMPETPFWKSAEQLLFMISTNDNTFKLSLVQDAVSFTALLFQPCMYCHHLSDVSGGLSTSSGFACFWLPWSFSCSRSLCILSKVPWYPGGTAGLNPLTNSLSISPLTS